jgi:hypothetical protein
VAVESWLGPILAPTFFDQSPPDQRHGYLAALAVIAAGRDEPEMVVAALMHDVGKRHFRLGVIGRSIASILARAGLPLTERMAGYRDHGLHAAKELVELGAPALAIDFALHHHGERPPNIDADTWRILKEADEPAKAGVKWAPGIISAVR